MMKKALLPCAIAASLAPAVGYAEIINVGIADDYNSLPLGIANGHVRYQQVYGATAFSSITNPIEITSISFSGPAMACSFVCWPNPQSIADGTYELRLSTTSRGVAQLATTFDNNLGSDLQVFYAGLVEDTLTFTSGTPFLYDPSLGNLLLDLTIGSQAANGAYFWISTSRTDEMSRLWGSGPDAIVPLPSQVDTRHYGLVTAFEVREVPLPAAAWLFGSGALALAGVARRRGYQQ